MRLGLTIGLSLMLSLIAGHSWSMPCFDRYSEPVATIGTECNLLAPAAITSEGQVLARDLETKTPLFTAYTGPESSKKTPRFGIRDAQGNAVGPAVFQSVYVVSRTLGVGVLLPKAKGTGQAYLIDLVSGNVRPTAYSSILMTQSVLQEQPPFLLGVVDAANGVVSVLSSAGADTGLVLAGINTSLHHHQHNLRLTVETYSAGMVVLRLNGKTSYLTLKGAPPAEGRPLKNGDNRGLFVEVGPAPKEVRGERVTPLYAPVDAFGSVSSLPSGVLGLVHDVTGRWYTVRSTAQGIRIFAIPDESRPPNLDATPDRGGFLALNLTRHRALRLMADGWDDGYEPPVKDEAQAVAESNKRVEAFVAAVMADEARNEAAVRQRNIDAVATQKAADEAARLAVQARIKRAKAENWSGFSLRQLEMDATRNGLEEEYAQAGLYMSDDFKRQTCLWKKASFCPAAAQASNSSAGFTSTWEKAFENARALNQSQYRENCAAAFQGASRACVIP